MLLEKNVYYSTLGEERARHCRLLVNGAGHVELPHILPYQDETVDRAERKISLFTAERLND
jgi:hypothetical protein